MTEQRMTSGERDRRGFLREAAAVAAAVGAGALLSGSAHAAQAPHRVGQGLADPLPPVGVDIPCSMYSANVPLKLNILGALTLDFKGGINLGVRTAGEDGLVLEVQGFRMEADTSPSTPNSGILIALTMSNATITPLSVLRKKTGGGLEMLLYLSLTTEVIDKATGETLLMLATDPTKYATLWASDVKAFPPVNQPYTLREPVQLFEMQGDTVQTDKPAGVLEGFDGIINGSGA
ncbi:twin-arginine translocation signal domain-containing protein [Streptomyces sp. NPDC052236]|uniref:twin-arginine translocation signal domain-containing protein n=1 Tax=Streptomyces sp. NPDC052236 TaxID=3365686 RepID=UPI0037D2CBBD